MNAVDRFVRIVQGESVDRVPVVGVTSVVTVDLMREVGTRWPDAHHAPEQMARAGAAAHVLCGLESVKVPFDMAVEAGALGADIDFGAEATLPKIRTAPFSTPDALEFGDDILTRGRFPVVLEAIRIARRQYGDTVPVLSSMLGPFHALGLSFWGGDALDLDDRGAGQGAGGHDLGHPSRRPVHQGAIRGRRACRSDGGADGIRRSHLAGAIPGACGAVSSRVGSRTNRR